jgi:hypothetical protein
VKKRLTAHRSEEEHRMPDWADPVADDQPVPLDDLVDETEEELEEVEEEIRAVETPVRRG